MLECNPHFKFSAYAPESGMRNGTEYGTHLAYHKHANYVALPINYPLPVQRVK